MIADTSAARGQRPSIYTPELAEAICDRLAAGESLRSICRGEGMPGEGTVREWADAEHEDRPGFAGRYASARLAGIHALAAEVLEIADDGSDDWMKKNDPENPGYAFNGEHVQRARLRIDARKWLLSKMLPAVYGEKVTAEVTGGVEHRFVLLGAVEADSSADWEAAAQPVLPAP